MNTIVGRGSKNDFRDFAVLLHATMISWLEMLKAVYLVFTLRPWHKNVIPRQIS